THLNGRKLDQFDLPNEAAALAAKAAVERGAFSVVAVEKKRTRCNPPPPFTTSTLQQDASRKLHMTAQQIMRTAQQLYEGVEIGGETVGLITYMRTDGVQMAREAINAVRSQIGTAFGTEYLPAAPREYQTKAKNAQEAHEAIRPTDFTLTPERAARHLNNEQARLYELIYKRALASQMQSAEIDQTSVDIGDGSGTVLRATGSILAFDGFLKLYREELEDNAEDEDSRLLPPMVKSDPLNRGKVTADQHFTQPPPRYSEATLVKKMEELGIGRPSTYASILTVLRERNYVRMDARRFIPEDRGRLVTAFLVSFFGRYVETGFTAALEEKLDEVSDGKLDWRRVMRDFWVDFSNAIDQTRDLKIGDVIDALDEELGPHFFPAREDGTDPRVCQACGTGRLGLKLGRYGSFIGCSNYPECQYTRKLAIDGAEDGGDTLRDGMKVLGENADGIPVTLRRGPYGLYIQLGEPDPEDKKAKPRRAALPKGVTGDGLTLEQALGLLSLPRVVGVHPETKAEIQAGIGRFGPYVKMGPIFASLDKDDDVLAVGLNRAVMVLAKKQEGIRELGPHPKGGDPVMVRKGRFGPYAQHGKTVANLPRGTELDTITLDEAIALLAEKGKTLAPKGKKGGKAPARKPAAEGAAPAKAAAARPKPKAKSKSASKAKAKPQPKAAPEPKAAKG
ncbi:MAG: type I DNA topoisomerase, partial [Acidiphilium sp.]|nr:type I DNA topoisomerase [Acidiphilium sp.]